VWHIFPIDINNGVKVDYIKCEKIK